MSCVRRGGAGRGGSRGVGGSRDAREECGDGLAGEEARVCVVGDTPEDVRAARANGVDVIAVATGIIGAEELVAAGPTRCVGGLGELMG